jgi:hypothetical protein
MVSNLFYCYFQKYPKHLVIGKKERKYTLVSLNVKRLVYEIYVHFQW